MQLPLLLLLAVAACGLADARGLQQASPGAGQTAESALGVELVDMLLGSSRRSRGETRSCITWHLPRARHRPPPTCHRPLAALLDSRAGKKVLGPPKRLHWPIVAHCAICGVEAVDQVAARKKGSLSCALSAAAKATSCLYSRGVDAGGHYSAGARAS